MKTFLLLIFILLVGGLASCTTERERRGVSHIPFNAPPPEAKRTFHGDL